MTSSPRAWAATSRTPFTVSTSRRSAFAAGLRQAGDPPLPALDGQASTRARRPSARRNDSDAAQVWTDATNSEALRANLAALPGFGEMKMALTAAVLFKHLGVEAARDLMSLASDA